MGSDYYDRLGNPVDLEGWAKAFGPADRRVAFTRVTDAIDVSTVFIGLDYNFSGEGQPLIYETMVFVLRDEPMVIEGEITIDREGTECWRWPTELEAIEGHLSVVRDLASNVGSDPGPVLDRTEITRAVT